MKRLLTTVFMMSAIGLAQAQPKITAGGVVNSASYAAAGLPNGAIAQGSLFVVFGNGMGPAALQQITAYPLTPALAGTSLTVTINGTATKPLMVYTSAGQLAAIMPSATPVGTGTLTVTYNGATSGPEPVRVVPNSVGIYSVNQGGSGAGIITNTNYQVAGLNAAANTNEAFIIWATGVGPVTGDEAAGGAAVKIGTIPVEVLVGGKSAPVIGYARAGCCAGLDQIAFTVPAGISGCSVPVAVKIGNVISNYVTLSVATSGRTCTEPAGINPIVITSNGTVSVGGVDLSRSTLNASVPGTGVFNTVSDSGSASFTRYNYASYISTANPFQISTFGSCTVFSFSGGTATVPAIGGAVDLDAGPVISINGPNGLKTLPKAKSYTAELGGGGIDFPGLPPTGTPLYLVKGTYTIDNGAGGADVGAFKTTLNVPDPLVWTNIASVSTVNRANSQLVTWSGGDPTSNVYIYGLSTTGPASAVIGVEFVCVERTSAGQFTIPSAVLLSLPPSGSLGGVLYVENVTTAPFTAKGLDQGLVSASSTTLKTVNYQ